jgi:hypothetical protein
MTMRTLVYQSYRTHDVPAWIDACMAQTRAWALARGYDYRAIGDEIFDLGPDWFRARLAGRKLPLTDLGRLLLAKRFLEEDHDRVIWVDADVLIFDPDGFEVDPGEAGYVLCREVWSGGVKFAPVDTVIKPMHRHNNCVMGFARANTFLPFYIDTALRIARHAQEFNDWSLGPGMLTGLFQRLPVPSKDDVAMMIPFVLLRLLGRLGMGTDVLEQYLKLLPARPRAANLGGSNVKPEGPPTNISHADMALLVERLLATRDLAAAAVPNIPPREPRA